MVATELMPCPNFINGEWTTPDVKAFNPVYNPSTGEKIAEAPMSGPDIVNQAVQAAADAFPDWWQNPCKGSSST